MGRLLQLCVQLCTLAPCGSWRRNARSPRARPVTHPCVSTARPHRPYFCDGVNVGTSIAMESPTSSAAVLVRRPRFENKHEFYPAARTARASPTNSMFSYVHDLNAKAGRRAGLRAGPPAQRTGTRTRRRWPQAGRALEEALRLPPHPRRVPAFVDIDADGKPEILAHGDALGHDQAGLRARRSRGLHADHARGKYDQFYHGTVVGDVTATAGSTHLTAVVEAAAGGAGREQWKEHPLSSRPRRAQISP